MALTPHTNWQYGSYLADRAQFIKALENPLLAGGNTFYLRPYYDGSIAIGYGFDLLRRSVAEAKSYLIEVGGTFSLQAETLLSQYHADRAAGLVTATYLQTLASNLRNHVSLPSGSAATSLFTNVTDRQFEPNISLVALPQSRERIAIVSYMYQFGSAGIPTTLSLINNGQSDLAQRAKIWFQIRYNSGTGDVARRQAESNLFGLFNTANGNFGGNDVEARVTVAYLYTQKVFIASRGQVPDFESQIAAAKTYLQDTYTDGNTVDRVVNDTYESNSLTGTGERDLIFGNANNDIVSGGEGSDFIYGGTGFDSLIGEGGNDAINGEAGLDYLSGGAGDDELDGGADADYLEGGSGFDTLRGGDGNDYLRGGFDQDLLSGGSGYDTYLYNPGDGYDTIYDEDGSGRVMYGTIALTGGRRRERVVTFM